MRELLERVAKWADARNIIDGATPASQFEKLSEELGELGRALIEDDQGEVEDAIGDMTVVLAILSEQRGTTLESCLSRAYSEIKDRKGKMVNGIFQKEDTCSNS